MSITTPSDVKCSFCGKPQGEVRRLVAGPGVYICNECIELSVAVIAPTAEEKAELITAADRRTQPTSEVEAAIRRYFIDEVSELVPADEFDALVRSIKISQVVRVLWIEVESERPGLLIGRRGETSDRLRDALAKLTGLPVRLNIAAVKPEQ